MCLTFFGELKYFVGHTNIKMAKITEHNHQVILMIEQELQDNFYHFTFLFLVILHRIHEMEVHMIQTPSIYE